MIPPVALVTLVAAFPLIAIPIPTPMPILLLVLITLTLLAISRILPPEVITE